jgi:hypothetical protein
MARQSRRVALHLGDPAVNRLMNPRAAVSLAGPRRRSPVADQRMCGWVAGLERSTPIAGAGVVPVDGAGG